MLPFVNHLEITCFILQLLSTVILVLGLQKLTFRFIKNKYLGWLATLIAMIPLNDFTLGNVELYSECIQASSLAVAIIVWALNLFLDRKFLWAAGLMSVATFIQVLEGLDVMIVLCIVMLFMALIKQTDLKTFILFGCIYAFTAGIYLILIFKGKQFDGGLTNERLFKILFEFRHPHHFIFSSFPKFKMIVFFALTFLSLIFYSEHSSKTFDFILVGLFGIIFYALAVDDFHSIFIGNFQFYKLTIWMKFLGVVAAVGLAEELYLSKWKLPDAFKLETVAICTIIVLSWGVILRFNEYLPYHVPFQIFGLKEKDDMISICEKIKEVTPKDAVFIQPFDNTELKFYGQRSSFVEFKANVRHKKYVGDWYQRILLIYGLSPNSSEKGFALKDLADVNYYTHNLWRFNARNGFGITHMLVNKDYKPPFGTLIVSNNTYAVYQL